MTITDTTLLQKIISLQSAIIEGYSLKTILRQETPFFLEESGANVIAVCIENEGGADIELILEEKFRFLSLISKYKLSAKHLEFDRFLQQCNSHFTNAQTQVVVESLHHIFDGNLSKKKTAEFEKELGFDHALLSPIRNKAGRRIGMIIYLFTDKKEKRMNISPLTEIFELLTRLLYDEDRHILRARCVQIDERMKRLTGKEKEVTQLVLQGKSHKEIAQEMTISINTVKTHMKNIFSKYGVSSKIELHNKLTVIY